ncbi:uncharacterized protein H6S33_000725 [Morchella sextelata]|uniref:uncharacterized protein n=1 Tax=Morchella sextelata TaxID=1174677 RepID=UPI001D058BD6|nr:uncharacterized protein H6S33_000725 [Morchella sextelata]KAH0615089.1 hypothetical protein H6S33_000725 [Morchella sextelata]
MPTFTSKKYLPASAANTVGSKYRSGLSRHPFLLFGLPFIGTILAGSFFLTPATALRYENHDRKVKRVTQEEAMGLGKDRRRVDLNEEYYRLSMKDTDNWEQKRVKRLKGEHDGVL